MKKILFPLLLLTIFSSCGVNEPDEEYFAKMPAAQREFIEHRFNSDEAYNDAENSIKRSQIYNDERAFCCSFASRYGYSFKGWAGEIKGIYTDRGGDEARVIVRVEPYGNSAWDMDFESQYFDMGSPMYKKLTNLQEGQMVAFDFTFGKAVDALKASINDKCYATDTNREWKFLMNCNYQVTITDIKELP